MTKEQFITNIYSNINPEHSYTEQIFSVKLFNTELIKLKYSTPDILEIQKWFSDEIVDISGNRYDSVLSKSVSKYNSSNNIFDLILKSMGDFGQILYFSAKYKNKIDQELTIFHTLDSWCAGIASLFGNVVVCENAKDRLSLQYLKIQSKEEGIAENNVRDNIENIDIICTKEFNNSYYITSAQKQLIDNINKVPSTSKIWHQAMLTSAQTNQVNSLIQTAREGLEKRLAHQSAQSVFHKMYGDFRSAESAAQLQEMQANQEQLQQQRDQLQQQRDQQQQQWNQLQQQRDQQQQQWNQLQQQLQSSISMKGDTITQQKRKRKSDDDSMRTLQPTMAPGMSKKHKGEAVPFVFNRFKTGGSSKYKRKKHSNGSKNKKQRYKSHKKKNKRTYKKKRRSIKSKLRIKHRTLKQRKRQRRS